MNIRRALLLSATALIPLSYSPCAHAQTAGAPGSTTGNAPVAAGAPTEATDQTSSGIADIVVTAQRRSESIQNVPIAITAVSGEQLAQSGIRNLQELTTLVAGYTGPGDIAFSSPHLRGIGSQIASPGLENSVALYVDGVYIGAPSPALLRLTNVEQIEVLKGPQGTLFGRNTTGGLIQVTTRNPEKELQAAFEVGYGNYQLLNSSAYINVPISNSIATNLAVQVTGAGKGYGTNLATGNPTFKLDKEVAVRNKWDIDFGGGTELLLMGDYEYRSDLNFLSNRSAPGTVIAPGYVSMVDGWNANSVSDVRVRSEAYGLTGRLSHDLGFATLTNTLAYRRTSFDLLGFTSNFAPRPFNDLTFYWYTDNKQLTDELQLSSNSGGRFKWTAGLFYYNAVDKNWQPAVAGPAGPPFNFVTRTRLKTESIAGYVQASYEIASGTTFTLGGRYSIDDHSVSGTFIHTPSFFAFLDQTSTLPSFSRGSVAARASLSHKFDNGVLLYASYNRGTKSGGFNSVQVNNPPFGDEKLDAYEIGTKSDLFGRKVRLNVAGFYYDYRNIQVQSFKNAGPPTIYNAASATLYGVDAEIQLRPTSNLNISGTAAYTHSEFGNFPTAEFYLPCTPAQVPTGQCSAAYTAAGAGYYLLVGNAKGLELPRAPQFTASTSINYTIPVESGKFDLNTTYAYNGGFFTTVGHEGRQNAFGRLGASIQYSNDAQGYYVRLFGTNLTQSRDVQGYDFNQSGPVIRLNTPRQYGIVFGAKLK